MTIWVSFKSIFNAGYEFGGGFGKLFSKIEFYSKHLFWRGLLEARRDLIQ
jgi:hypothetical protein